MFAVIGNQVVNLAECVNISQKDRSIFFMTRERRDFNIEFASAQNATVAMRQLIGELQQADQIKFTIAG